MITEEFKEKLLSLYNVPVLVDASIQYPQATGHFVIPKKCFYVSKRLGEVQHATDIEIQLCLNQLSYYGVFEAIRQGIPEFQGIDFEELVKDGMFITRSDKRFRKQIPTGQKIHGQLNLNRLKQRGNSLFAWADFDFENRSCFGNLEMAIRKNGHR